MRILASIFFSCSCLTNFAQNNPIEKKIGLDLNYGSIYAHTKDVENTRGANPRGFQINYSWRKTDSIIFQRFSGFPTQSVFINYTNFDNSILGQSVTAAYAIRPEIRFSEKTGLQFSAAAGISYLTNPFDAIHNPTNSSYSTHISAYLGVGALAYWQVNPNWQIQAGFHYRHLSNAGIKLPNKGVNWVTADIGIHYFLNERKKIRPIIQQYTNLPYQKYTWWEAFVFGAARSTSNESTVRYGVVGAGINYVKQINRTHAFTVGTELYHDGALAQILQAENKPINKATALSVLGGHQFVWGPVRFTQQIGIYILSHGSYYPAWYHRWGLQYFINEKWALGINLKAHKQVAQFPDIRVIYLFGRKERK